MSEDRIRVGGLWARNTSIGTVLSGGITVEQLRKIATDAGDMGDPLELVLFENKRGKDRSPTHTLFVAKRRQRDEKKAISDREARGWGDPLPGEDNL